MENHGLNISRSKTSNIEIHG